MFRTVVVCLVFLTHLRPVGHCILLHLFSFVMNIKKFQESRARSSDGKHC